MPDIHRVHAAFLHDRSRSEGTSPRAGIMVLCPGDTFPFICNFPLQNRCLNTVLRNLQTLSSGGYKRPNELDQLAPKLWSTIFTILVLTYYIGIKAQKMQAPKTQIMHYNMSKKIIKCAQKSAWSADRGGHVKSSKIYSLRKVAFGTAQPQEPVIIIQNLDT